MHGVNRTGDKVSIAGNYQHNALFNGNYAQRAWHRLRLKTVADIAAVEAGHILLDIGCGSGTLLNFLPKQNVQYIGIDANEAAVNFCQKQYSGANISFSLGTIESLTEHPENYYDRIFLLEVIEHITRMQGENLLRCMVRMLKPGGKLIITTPNAHSMWPVIERILDLFKLTPNLGDEQHEHLYSIKELKSLALSCGYIPEVICTTHGLAPWLAFLGDNTALPIHNWERKNQWFPGSIITMLLKKPPVMV